MMRGFVVIGLNQNFVKLEFIELKNLVELNLLNY